MVTGKLGTDARMAMKKYLYGKQKFLSGLISGKRGLRFSDIAHYSVMENEKMRDDELAKEFHYDKNEVGITINGIVLNPADMTTNPSLIVTPYRCFCVCLSGKKDDEELYERFEADVCIEIDVEELVKFLTIAAGKFDGMGVVHNSVSYYPPVMSDPAPDFNAAVFFKRDIYCIEDEYRIAITIPAHRENFRSETGEPIKIFSDEPGELRHMFIESKEEWINRSYVTNVYYRDLPSA